MPSLDLYHYFTCDVASREKNLTLAIKIAIGTLLYKCQEQANQKFPMINLPLNILEELTMYLDEFQLQKFSMVCKKWEQASQTSPKWKLLCKERCKCEMKECTYCGNLDKELMKTVNYKRLFLSGEP